MSLSGSAEEVWSATLSMSPVERSMVYKFAELVVFPETKWAPWLGILCFRGF